VKWLLAVVATLAFAPAAYAQGAAIQAGPADVAWSPPEVTIKAGETVTWSWTGFHNVQSTSANWTVQGDTSPFSHQFPTAGTYDFVCVFHAAQGMTGRVIVTDAGGNPPPPPPPPPPSEQSWANDQQPPPVLETGSESSDQTAPRLRRVRATSIRNGARVRFRLSERARVVVRLELVGITVKTVRETLRAGSRTITIRDRRLHGRYRVEIVAEDSSGNRSPVKHDRVTIR
jgi:plastocyanin